MYYQINCIPIKSNHFRLRTAVAFISLLLLLTACGGGGGDTGGGGSTGSNISGMVQKGAFQTGADITVQQLTSNASNGEHRATAEVSSNQGEYSLKTDWFGWAEMTVEGQYFDEYAASIAGTSIKLNGIQRLDEGDVSVNVNLFSHFVAERIKYRVQNTSDTLAIAKSDAENELQIALKLANVRSEQLDLQDGSSSQHQANAVLLLFSGSFMAAGGDATLLNILVEDFKVDGRFDVSALQEIINQANVEGMMSRLTKNLKDSGVANPPDASDLGELPDWTPPENITPIANSASITMDEDASRTITLSASDADGNVLTYALVDQPQHGSANLVNGIVSYSPAENYHGDDSFTFVANDGEDNSSTATISITINEVNDAPVARNGSLVTGEGETKSVTLSASDIDDTELTYELVDQAEHGNVSISGNIARYTPSNNYVGSDAFTFKANDDALSSNVATITITVSEGNAAPVITHQHLGEAQEDKFTDITLRADDPENDSLTYQVVSQPVHGRVEINTSNGIAKARYRPDANYHGSDSFRFKVNDGEFDSNTARVEVTVTPVNDDPVANDGRATTDMNTDKVITLVASDIDSSNLSYQVEAQAAHGSVVISGGEATYSPDNNHTGDDRFTFRAFDGEGGSNIASVTITINSQATIKILPLGDSITHTHVSQLSYRHALWKLLLDEDVDFDFIGSEIQTYGGARSWPDYNGQSFDQDHEGHTSWRVDQIVGSINGWLEGNTPDVVLLHLGTNDILQGQDTASTVEELEDVIEKLQADNSSVDIFLAKIIPSSKGSANDGIEDLNDHLDSLANRLNTVTSRVIIVDMFTGFNVDNDTYDGLHPNLSGERKMSQHWFDGMKSSGIF